MPKSPFVFPPDLKNPKKSDCTIKALSTYNNITHVLMTQVEDFLQEKRARPIARSPRAAGLRRQVIILPRMRSLLRILYQAATGLALLLAGPVGSPNAPDQTVREAAGA
jgi:hypothetical protein